MRITEILLLIVAISSQGMGLSVMGDPNHPHQYPVLFENIGRMVTSLSYLHTYIPINLTAIEEHLLLYRAQLTPDDKSEIPILNITKTKKNNISFSYLNNGKAVSDLTLSLWQEIIALHLRGVDEMYQDIQTLKNILPPVSNPEKTIIKGAGKNIRINQPPDFDGFDDSRLFPTRHRRHPAILLAALPGLLGTALGIYNTVQIQYIWEEIHTQKTQIGRLINVAEAQDVHLRELDEAIRNTTSLVKEIFQHNPAILSARLNRIEDQIRHRIEKATHAIQQAQHRRLSIDYLTDLDMTLLYRSLVRRADYYGNILAIDKPSDLYQLELSYLFDGHIASLILHVPMYPKDGTLRLYKLHPFPLPFYDSFLLIPDVRQDIIAIAEFDSTYHHTLSSTELLGCQSINSVYLCERNGVLSKKQPSSCLGALYQSDYTLAKAICKFYLEKIREYVYQLLDNWFIVYSPKAQTVPTKCKNGTAKEIHIPRNVSKFHLSPGCTAHFEKHLVFSDQSIKLPTDFIQLNWDWEPTKEIFSENTGYHLVSAEIERLKTYGIGRPQLSDLQTLVMQAQRIPDWTLSTHSSGFYIALIVGAAILVFIFIRARIWYRERKSPILEQPVGYAPANDRIIIQPLLANPHADARPPHYETEHPNPCHCPRTT